MAYLPYMFIPETAHFGGHAVAVFGVDEAAGKACVYDRGKGPVEVSIADLEKARGSRHKPYPPQNRMYALTRPFQPQSLDAEILAAIRDCCRAMLDPPIKNIGLAGLQKWADLVVRWPAMFSGLYLLGCMMSTFTGIATGGTGGSAFRRMYARFLEEAAPLVGRPGLKEVAAVYRQSAKIWDDIAVAALPDSCPELKKLRESMVEKNRCLEEQGPGHQERMKELFDQEQALLHGDLEGDLAGADRIVAGLRELILQCREVETRACTMLAEAIQ